MEATNATYMEAAEKSVTEPERLGLWPIFGYYSIQEEGNGDAIAVAARTVPKDFKPASSEKDPIDLDHTMKDGRRVRVRRRNPANQYMPLRDCPDLFDRFARLADEGEIGQQTWREWLEGYGVLGVLPGKTGPYQRDDATDSYLTFVQEARLANRMLRLFEAVTGPNGPDVETIRRLLPDGYGRHDLAHEPDQLERAALHAIRETVEQKVHADCFLRLVPRDTGWRKKNMSPFAPRWVFTSLLGAMWLQFSWLVTMDDLRYCEACGKHIPPHERPDKKVCNATCRQKLYRSKRNR